MIKFNESVIKRLLEYGFFPDTMLTAAFTLQCLKHNEVKLLDTLDDDSSSKRMMLVYYDLVRRGLIEESSDDASLLYHLTPQGNILVRELEFLAEPNIVVDADKVAKKKKDDTADWIKEWSELWPQGIKSGGKYVRVEPIDLLPKMTAFRKKYGYDKDTIMKATKKYLEAQAAKNWEFTRVSIYFIEKRGEGSDLAACCADLKLGPAPTEMKQRVINANLTGLV